jgi:hypothetical protein
MNPCDCKAKYEEMIKVMEEALKHVSSVEMECPSCSFDSESMSRHYENTALEALYKLAELRRGLG